MDALRKAVTAGLENGEDLMQNEPDLAILRDRRDYMALLVEAPALWQRAEVAKGKAQSATQKQQAAAGPHHRQLQADLAASQHALGRILLSQGKSDEAVEALRQALNMRERLTADEPNSPSGWTELAATWTALGETHWQTGRLAESITEWKKAAKTLDAGRKPNADARAIRETKTAWFDLGLAYAKAGLWNEASTCYERQGVEDWFHTALLRLRMRDVSGYRQVCAVMSGLLEKTANSGEVEPGVQTWVCALDERAAVDPKQLAKWAEQELETHKLKWGLFWPRHVLALAYYRAGRFEKAVSFANESDKKTNWLSRNSNWPVLAMAHHRLGHTNDARRWLDLANQEWRERSPLAQSIDAANVLGTSADPLTWQDHVTWHDWLIFEQLLAEANTLIVGHRGEADCLEMLHDAYLSTKLGEKKKADEAFQAAVRGRDKVASAWLARGRVYLLLGDKDRARADFAKARELDPKDPQIQKEYGASGGKEKSSR
jgi:tetratricopeptide (TPR) repeat protein